MTIAQKWKNPEDIIPPSAGVSAFGVYEGAAYIVNPDGNVVFLGAAAGNIIANAGVGLEADIPAAPVKGDIFVSSDTLLKFVAISTADWESSSILSGQIISDTSQPGTPLVYQLAGGALILINGVVSNFDLIDFNPQAIAPVYKEGRTYYNNVQKAFESYSEVADISPTRNGRTLRSRVYNNSGNTIAKGKLCKITGITPPSPNVNLSDNSKIKDIKLIVGMAMHDIPDGDFGYLAVFDTVSGVDTSGMSPNDLVYADPSTLGGFTNVEPQPPFPSYPIGFVSVVGVNGVIGIRVGGFSGSDTSINLKGILNGLITQKPQIDFVSDGTTITATVSNDESPGDPLPFLLNDTRYLLPTGLSVTVPPGADANTLQASILYVYLNAGAPALGIATSRPSIPFCTVAEIAVFNAARTQSDGRPFAYRRSNNSIDNKNGVEDGALGLVFRQIYAIRKKLGSNWLIGQDGTPTVNNTTIKLALTAGQAMQFNEVSTPSFDGNEYVIYNDTLNLATFEEVANLTAITVDASGNTLLSNNKFYTIRLFYLLNSNGVGNSVIATRPKGSYSTASEAINDASNYRTDLNDTTIEEIVYPLYDLVIGRTGTGGSTISLVSLIDRRSKLATGSGGGGASGGGGTDDKVRISAADTTNDYLNPKIEVGDEITKTINNPAANETLLFKLSGWFYNVARSFKAIFNMESLTADRTYTLPDKAGTIALLSDVTGGDVSRNYQQTAVSGTTLTVDFASKNEVVTTGVGGSGVQVESNISLTYSNDFDGGTNLKKFAYVYLDVINAAVTPWEIQMPTNIISNDSRFNSSTFKVSLTNGNYLLKISYDGANHDQLEILPKELGTNDLGFALSDETTDLTTDNDGEREVIRACQLQSLTFYVNTSPTGSAIVCDVYKNTTLIQTITLPVSTKTITVANTTAFAVGDRIKADITQIGSTVAGTGAKLEPKAILV